MGAFLVCGVLMWLSGVTKVFARMMGRIPVSLASALLAFSHTQLQPTRVLTLAGIIALLVQHWRAPAPDIADSP